MNRQAVSIKATAETVPITVRLSIDDMNRLGVLSDRTGKPKERLIQKFVSEGAEDMVDVIIAKDAQEELRAGKCRVYTQTEADTELELDS